MQKVIAMSLAASLAAALNLNAATEAGVSSMAQTEASKRSQSPNKGLKSIKASKGKDEKVSAQADNEPVGVLAEPIEVEASSIFNPDLMLIEDLLIDDEHIHVVVDDNEGNCSKSSCSDKSDKEEKMRRKAEKEFNKWHEKYGDYYEHGH